MGRRLEKSAYSTNGRMVIFQKSASPKTITNYTRAGTRDSCTQRNYNIHEKCITNRSLILWGICETVEGRASRGGCKFVYILPSSDTSFSEDLGGVRIFFFYIKSMDIWCVYTYIFLKYVIEMATPLFPSIHIAPWSQYTRIIDRYFN